jgi:phospholipase/lecithinase/hemolysin
MKLAFTLPVLALAPTATVGGPLQQRSRELLKKFTSLVVFGDSYTDNGIRSYKPPVAAEVQPQRSIESEVLTISNSQPRQAPEVVYGPVTYANTLA